MDKTAQPKRIGVIICGIGNNSALELIRALEARGIEAMIRDPRIHEISIAPPMSPFDIDYVNGLAERYCCEHWRKRRHRKEQRHLQVKDRRSVYPYRTYQIERKTQTHRMHHFKRASSPREQYPF